MRGRATAGAATALVVLVGFAGGQASAHDVIYKSQVTLDDYGPVKPRVITNFFTGRVKSPQGACRPDRKVKVYLVDAGPDTLIGTQQSEADGKWYLGNDQVGPGDYYAKLIRRDIGQTLHDHLCKRARSDVLTVS